MAVVDRLTRERECKTCEAYREFLEKETEEKRYYQQLLLSKAGLLNEVEKEQLSVRDFPVLHRGFTLSGIRREASRYLKKKAENGGVVPAEEHDLTPGEKLFQQKLGDNSAKN